METLETKIKSKWAKLSDQDVEELHGNLDALPDKLHDVYGMAEEKAAREVSEFKKSLSGSSGSVPQRPRDTNA